MVPQILSNTKNDGAQKGTSVSTTVTGGVTAIECFDGVSLNGIKFIPICVMVDNTNGLSTLTIYSQRLRQIIAIVNSGSVSVIAFPGIDGDIYTLNLALGNATIAWVDVKIDVPQPTAVNVLSIPYESGLILANFTAQSNIGVGSNSTVITIGIPNTKIFQLKAFISSDVSQVVAGDSTLSIIETGVGAIFSAAFYIPSVPNYNTQNTQIEIINPPLYITGENHISASINNPLLTGSISFNLTYGY